MASARFADAKFNPIRDGNEREVVPYRHIKMGRLVIPDEHRGDGHGVETMAVDHDGHSIVCCACGGDYLAVTEAEPIEATVTPTEVIAKARDAALERCIEKPLTVWDQRQITNMLNASDRLRRCVVCDGAHEFYEVYRDGVFRQHEPNCPLKGFEE